MTQEMQPWLDVAVAVVNLIGVPVAIGLFFFTKRRERLEREYGTYDSLDEKYIEYLNVCLDHPHLDVFDLAKPRYRSTPELRWQERQVFSMLIAIFERAFLLYKDKASAVRKAQWQGWDKYMKDWVKRRNFRLAWKDLKGEYDSSFESYLTSLLLPDSK